MNKEKSSVLFSNGLSRKGKREIVEVWGLHGMKNNSILPWKQPYFWKKQEKGFLQAEG